MRQRAWAADERLAIVMGGLKDRKSVGRYLPEVPAESDALLQVAG